MASDDVSEKQMKKGKNGKVFFNFVLVFFFVFCWGFWSPTQAKVTTNQLLSQYINGGWIGDGLGNKATYTCDTSLRNM